MATASATIGRVNRWNKCKPFGQKPALQLKESTTSCTVVTSPPRRSACITLESTVTHLGIEGDDVLGMAEQVEL